MKLTGIELRNFRSIGDDPVTLMPLRKCNILIGQNNAGKSNVLKAVQRISDKYQADKGKGIGLDEIDLHQRQQDRPFRYKLWFEAESSIDNDLNLSRLTKGTTFWFEFAWSRGQTPIIIDNIFAHISDFQQANELLDYLTHKVWRKIPPRESMIKEFMEAGNNIFTRFSSGIPPVHFIPEFRRIQTGKDYTLDGTNLVELLAKYHMPVIGSDRDQAKFTKIQGLVRRLLHLPQAELEISRVDPTLIIKNNGLRLPLSSYGTGVHELIILVTAVLSIENAICCIEEPEIHLHPRLQRELIEFLSSETTNTYFLSTHSATFVNMTDSLVDVQVFHISRQQDAAVGAPILNQRESLLVLHDLGVKASDVLQANCILWVEGPSDRIYIFRWLKLIAPDLVEGRDYLFMYYRQVPRLSIDQNDQVNELINVLRLNQHAVVVADSDRATEDQDLDTVKTEMMEKCVAHGGVGWITAGREIENYLSSRTITKACKDLREVDIQPVVGAYDSFESAVNRALKEAGAKPIDYSKDKLSYSKKFAEHIELEDIEGHLRVQLEEIISRIRHWCR